MWAQGQMRNTQEAQGNHSAMHRCIWNCVGACQDMRTFHNTRDIGRHRVGQGVCQPQGPLTARYMWNSPEPAPALEPITW